jgi:hypothetical protein
MPVIVSEQDNSNENYFARKKGEAVFCDSNSAPGKQEKWEWTLRKSHRLKPMAF